MRTGERHLLGNNATTTTEPRKYTKDEVLKILDSIRAVVSSGNASNSLCMVNSVIGIIRNDKYDLGKVLDAVKDAGSQQNYTADSIDSLGLTNVQRMRIERLQEKAYKEYIESGSVDGIREMADRITSEFPTPPKEALVYYGAHDTAILYKNYLGLWQVWDNHLGQAIAWAYDGYNLHLVNFYDGIFDGGIILCKDLHMPLIKLYESGEDAVVTDTALSGKIEFKCTWDEFEHVYRFCMSGKTVLSLNQDMMKCIYVTIMQDMRTEPDALEYFTKNLIMG